MAMGTLLTRGTSVDSLLTTTREAILKSRDLLQDAVFNSIPVLRWLRKKVEVVKQGGASILVPIMMGKNATFKAYTADEVIDTTGLETPGPCKTSLYAGTA